MKKLIGWFILGIVIGCVVQYLRIEKFKAEHPAGRYTLSFNGTPSVLIFDSATGKVRIVDSTNPLQVIPIEPQPLESPQPLPEVKPMGYDSIRENENQKRQEPVARNYGIRGAQDHVEAQPLRARP